jgi:hypothetical protein
MVEKAFLPVVAERVANLFHRDSPRHLLVEVDAIFIFVRATVAGSNTDTANGATADEAINTPLAKEAATGGDVAGDPFMVTIVSLCRHLCKYSTDV